MSNLYYTTNYGAGTVIIDGKVQEMPEQLRESYSKVFNIQVFGDAINPKDAKSPLFTCRNLLANIHCEYVGTDRSDKAIREAHISEACYRADHLNTEDTKELVLINCITFDASNEELAEIIKYLYDIIVNETMKTYGSSDSIVIYWDLSEEEAEVIKNQKEWNNRVYMDADKFVIITRK